MRRITSIVALFVVVLGLTLRSDDPVSSAVTFNREVVRILERKCLACHAPGGIAMSLATYREARPWARAIREELIEQRMPPWRAARGYGAFANDIGLTARELTMILTWTDGGVPKGDDRDLPRRALESRDAPLQPDQRLELPAQRIPAGEEHVIRRVTIDTGLATTRWIRQIAVLPGDTSVIRAAFVAVAPREGSTATHWLGAWTPWLHVMAPPAGAAMPVAPGARLVVELHYRGRETDLEDRSSLALFFAPESRQVSGHVVVEPAPTPSTDRHVRWRGETTFGDETRIWALVPHLSAAAALSDDDVRAGADGASSLEITARKADGSIDVLLWIPQRRYDWPTPYIPQTPILLPAGTTVVVTGSAPRGAERAEPPAVTLCTVRLKPEATLATRPPR